MLETSLLLPEWLKIIVSKRECPNNTLITPANSTITNATVLIGLKICHICKNIIIEAQPNQKAEKSVSRFAIVTPSIFNRKKPMPETIMNISIQIAVITSILVNIKKIIWLIFYSSRCTCWQPRPLVPTGEMARLRAAIGSTDLTTGSV